MTLSDALAEYDEFYEHDQHLTFEPVLAAAARRVAEAPEIEWCEEHWSLADTSEKCEGILYYEGRLQKPPEFTACRMVRKLLVDP